MFELQGPYLTLHKRNYCQAYNLMLGDETA